MRSDEVKQGVERAAARALLKADGLTYQDFTKPFIGIANSYTSIVPGHIHLKRLGEVVKDG
jgi:dihydroxy-acid dehydratase